MFKSVSLLLLSVFLTTQANAKPGSIGTEAVAGAQSQACVLEFKSPVARMTEFRMFCTGTLVHKNKILTAAHCLQETITTQDPAAELQARCNPTVTKGADGKSVVTYADTLEINTSALSMWKHPKYNPGANGSPVANDVGLYETTTDAKTAPAEVLSFSKIADPATGVVDPSKYECRTSGFGRNSQRAVGSPYSVNLKNYKFLPISQASLDKGEKVAIEQTLKIETKTATPEEGRNITFVLGMIFAQLTNPQTSSEGLTELFMTFNDLGLMKWSNMPGDSGSSIQCRDLTSNKESVIAVYSSREIISVDFFEKYLKNGEADFTYKNTFSPLSLSIDAQGNPVVGP